tara:strand:+ start:373 stop:498 length:126 start_codon:yes stop_codon:yes gene_type:complete
MIASARRAELSRGQRAEGDAVDAVEAVERSVGHPDAIRIPD